MPIEEPLAAATDDLRHVDTYAAVRAVMCRWAPQFHDLLGQRIASGPRPDLGLKLSTKMRGAIGFTARQGDSFFVSVGKGGARWEKRFTFAHELGHVLLSAVDRDVVPLNTSQEERLCDLFASHALAPRDKVRKHMHSVGMPTELSDVVWFARTFRISQRAAIVVLDDILPDRWPVAFVAASWQPHSKRGEMGLRVDAAASDRRFYFPLECRLGTLGYRGLETAVLREPAGSEIEGCDSGVDVRSRRRKVLSWSGSSSWSAWVQRAPGSSADAGDRAVLCRIEVEELRPMWTRPRPRSQVSRAPVEIPGQMSLKRQGWPQRSW